MAPRQRTTANLDDSRSEASSGTRERHPTGTKGRRAVNAAATSNPISSKDLKASAATTTTTGGQNAEPDHSGEPSGINWSSMPLSVLHQYRHAYNLPCPSSSSSQISSIILNQGIGLRSPTTIAARRAQLSARRKAANDASASRPSKKDDNTNNTAVAASGSGVGNGMDLESSRGVAGMDVHGISTFRGQGRVTKDHLATAVRKHFNNVGLVEQDAIARFLYKVREEGKGHEFRLRFQP
ncbi:uncharacterized protein PADG_03231 [Paracoccidioides brasiliensis Pb18]|uniref:Histone deacetylase complex subunit SAP30 Sin3 binding domain-containing protein n=2 Tax=Paracoccidioides brasiliensis TaxID=121759 RepID=C1G7S6_PARBD|nr:uncharacterized protein PADG_03231 [Paracoccidioides brasiliensis Pb18]EEH47133.1 hypothetical protein PADG_03231 [Paracoccidioides brasiliensis Pb18]ODH20286.1 hypothetical protein ACO22_05927 [Paracoccidioides brasiliensis]